MPNEYKRKDKVLSYRLYYKSKSEIKGSCWSKREIPDWWEKNNEL
jgi:hypothetical protein